MQRNLYFENLNILKNSGTECYKDSVLITDGQINSFGEEATIKASKRNITVSKSGNKLLAPLLVDIHSKLEDPISGFEDNLSGLKKRAKQSGFGTIALLPDSKYWRDNPEKIPFQNNRNDDLNIFFWGSFTLDDKGLFLSPHVELLNSGAIGLCSSLYNDLSIISQGIKLDYLNYHPILISQRERNSNQKSFLKEDIKALQSGFYTLDDSEDIIDIRKIIEIHNYHPRQKLIVKNISDPQVISELKEKEVIQSTISWWSLVADTNNLELNDIGWKVNPPISNKNTREALIKCLEGDLIDAIAVNSIPLSDEETYKAINDRKPGISSFELVLPLLWNELISKRSWDISKLWRHLSFLPSKLLGKPEEELKIGSKRWIIFDPDINWINKQSNLGYDSPSNFPKKDEIIKGKVFSNGLEF